MKGHFRRTSRPGTISLLHILLTGLWQITAHALPLARIADAIGISKNVNDTNMAEDPDTWIFLVTAFILVIVGGAFAGLTIALMGQDEMYLQVIATSGEGSEKRNAAKVLRLLHKGKHWVLVTLLVGNVITNETLPIVLDRSIGGGIGAAVCSTVLVIIFGEIAPQSVCVRFGLPIGAWMSPVVLGLMWIFAPITWPIAKLLDYLLGEDHGTTYKKAGLKTLVTLHKTMGTTPGERLNEDEVVIISGVLDLKAKSVGSIMTPMEEVFTLPADAVLDEEMMELILRQGYSRIPIHDPRNKVDFVGMLLVKMLITYDPEDARSVNEFALATLPETRPDTSCLDIINFFQQGKSHMVLVSDHPAESYGALGVVTLEDVIEELIGEEIIDESDVNGNPAPAQRLRLRVPKGVVVEDNNSQAAGDERRLTMDGADLKVSQDGREALPIDKRASIISLEPSRSPRATNSTVRRGSSNGPRNGSIHQVPIRQYPPEVMQHLRNLGPSNAASRPKSTRINTVKVKPGVPVVGTIPENSGVAKNGVADTEGADAAPPRVATPDPTEAQEGIGIDLVNPGKDASDGVQALQAGYGTMDKNSPLNGQSNGTNLAQDKDRADDKEWPVTSPEQYNGAGKFERPPKLVVERSGSHSTIGSLRSMTSDEGGRKDSRANVRSGSITESIIDANGVKKLVLEPTSSSEEVEAGGSQPPSKNQSRSGSHQGRGQDGTEDEGSKGKKKKRRPRHWNKKKGASKKEGGDENTPLLPRA